MIPEIIKQKIDDEAKRYSEEKRISIKAVKSLHGKTQLYYASLHGAEYGYSLAESEIERLKGLIDDAFFHKGDNEMSIWEEFKQQNNL